VRHVRHVDVRHVDVHRHVRLYMPHVLICMSGLSVSGSVCLCLHILLPLASHMHTDRKK
jgi:hypothetical protein